MNDCDIHLDAIVSNDNLVQQFRRRNKKYAYKRVAINDAQKNIDAGWEQIGRKSKKGLRLRKTKDIGVGFQDAVWCTLHKMGFYEMNGPREFAVSRYGLDIEKKIDIFAKDENCICLVECKSAEQPHSKRSLGLDIDQYAAIHKELEQTIRLHYKNLEDNTKYRFRWLLALKNIDLNESDNIRAKKANIMVIDENMVSYYEELSKHLGPASRYQFLADLFPGMIIPELLEPIPAIKGKMGGVVFYSFVIEPEKLLKIAYISHRGKTNEESLRTYQRMVSKKRLTNIAKYISEKSGIFPTSIVLDINTQNRGLRFDQAPGMAGRNTILGTLHLPNRLKAAWIIDGQHRLFAYSGLPEAKTATLPVIAFEGLEASEQQKLFIVINGEQVRVSKNLLNDLYDDLHWNSDVPKERLLALTSKVVKYLNEASKSPLRDRIIKIGGRRTATRNLTLTAITEELRRSRLLGYVHSVKDKEISPGLLYQHDLDSSFERATEVLTGYYSLFLENEKVNTQWVTGSGEGGYICTNQGMIATIRILRAILNHIEHTDHTKVRSRNINKLLDDIRKYLTPVTSYLGAASPIIIKQFRQQYAEAGVQASTFSLMKVISDEYPAFDPPGLKDYMTKTDTTNNQAAYQHLLKIETMIHEHVIHKLRIKYGDGYSNWWHLGVKEKIRNNAGILANKAGEYDSGFEKYLYLIDLKEIIEDNWDLFSETYTINAKHTDSRARRLSWYTKLNNIRNIVDHPPRGGINNEELEFVEKIREELTKKLVTR